jgi:hypothetical protein
MPVMAAGVHLPRMDRSIAAVTLFRYGERVHVAAEGKGVALAGAEESADAGAPDFCDLAGEILKGGQHVCACLRQIEIQFRYAVQRTAVSYQSGKHKPSPFPSLNINSKNTGAQPSLAYQVSWLGGRRV